MTGPSGVDAPAADSPRTIGDPFRAFAAAQQGDWERAERIVRDMSDDDLDALGRVTGRLVYPVTVEQEDRRFARFVGHPAVGDCVPTASPDPAADPSR